MVSLASLARQPAVQLALLKLGLANSRKGSFSVIVHNSHFIPAWKY